MNYHTSVKSMAILAKIHKNHADFSAEPLHQNRMRVTLWQQLPGLRHNDGFVWRKE